MCSIGINKIKLPAKTKQETKRNGEVRWRKHCSTKKTSEVGDHLLLNPSHMVNAEILTSAPKQVNKRKILEAFYIQTLQPTQNNQLTLSVHFYSETV